ncbi:hypothetical protein CVT24_007462 [Panaeolus cyanescens]|uniref:N-acetyltransferase domain-containing protein n=1 Tax=Panaeolus cyanescens TaxID=181874 RepID=A0A409W4Z7_9AGAR|nr:hypothetical protein CVT24_007462 [Panaeolus cyanescens]
MEHHRYTNYYEPNYYAGQGYVDPSALSLQPQQYNPSPPNSRIPPTSPNNLITIQHIESRSALTPGHIYTLHKPVRQPLPHELIDGTWRDRTAREQLPDRVQIAPRAPEHTGDASLPSVSFSVRGGLGPYLRDLMTQRVVVDQPRDRVFANPQSEHWKQTVLKIDWPVDRYQKARALKEPVRYTRERLAFEIACYVQEVFEDIQKERKKSELPSWEHNTSTPQDDIQIRVRPFQKNDEKEVQDLFVYAMNAGDESPFTIAMRAMWKEPMFLFLYTTTGLGLAAYSGTISQNTLIQYAGLVSAVLSISLMLSYRVYINSKFKEFSKEAFKGDMGNIEVHYECQELRNVNQDEDNLEESKTTKGGGLPKSGFWVAEAYGPNVKPCIVGMAGLDMHTKPGPYIGELRRVVVSPRARRKGVAKKLLKVLVEYARSQGVKSIVLSTSQYQQPAIRLYKNLGWKDAYTLRKRFLLIVVLIRGLSLDVEDFRG